MTLTTKILSQKQRSWDWETAVEFYDGKNLVETRVVSGKPGSYRLDSLKQKVQDNIDNPIVEERLYTQEEVDKLVSDAVKEAEIGR